MKTDQTLIACLEVAVAIARQNPAASGFRIARAIHDLQKFGQQLHRRYEAACSYPYASTEAYERRTERLETRAHEAASKAQITIGLQRDPRGWPVIVIVNNSEFRLGGAQ